MGMPIYMIVFKTKSSACLLFLFCFFVQTASGNVEAKVVCFYRRRDIPSSLIQLADKHASKFNKI